MFARRSRSNRWPQIGFFEHHRMAASGLGKDARRWRSAMNQPKQVTFSVLLGFFTVLIAGTAAAFAQDARKPIPPSIPTDAKARSDMRMPGFSAEASFCRTRNYYRAISNWDATGGGGRVVPQYSHRFIWECFCPSTHCVYFDSISVCGLCDQWFCYFIPYPRK
jgi:hypothetical protein